MGFFKNAGDYFGSVMLNGFGGAISEHESDGFSDLGKRMEDSGKMGTEEICDKTRKVPLVGGILSETMKDISEASSTIGHGIGRASRYWRDHT